MAMPDKRVQILLVEDDPDDYQLTRELLEEMPGMKVGLDWARDYAAAIRAVRECGHDIYLLDYRLGAKDGLELLREAIELGCKGPLILLTGAGDRNLALAALDAGASDYLIKGQFDAASLERTIRYAIRQAKSSEELEEKVKQRTAELESAMTALKVTEEFNRAVLESSPDCVKVLDTAGCLVSMNANGQCLLEIDNFDDFRGKEWTSLWPQEGQTRVAHAVAAALANRTDRFQAYSPTAKGTPKWWDVIVAPIQDADGKVNRIVSVARDVTDQIRAESILRDSEERYRSLFDSIDQGYCIIEVIFNKKGKAVDYTFVEVNPAFEKQTGITDAVGRSMRSIAPMHEEHWFKIYGDIALTAETARFENKAAALGRWYDVYAYRFGDPENHQVAVLFSDISERKHHESRLALLARLAEITRIATNADELLYAVSQAVGENLNARRTLFNEIDLDNDIETVHRDYCRDAPSVAGTNKISKYSPITLDEMKAGKTVVNFDSKNDPRTAKHYETAYAPAGERSYVAVPLMRGGRWVASLWASDELPRLWTTEEVRLIESIAERTWLAVEKLRNEVALRESEGRFASAFNSSPLSITITSLKTGKLVDVNETFIKMTGYSRAEAIGRSTTELGLWEKPADRDAELESVTSDGHVRNAEFQFRIRDGSTVTGLLSAELLELGGEPCALTVIQDITQRKQAEMARRESEERFTRFMHHLPGLAWIKDIEGRYVYANDAAAKAFNTTRENLYGKTDAEVFPPDIASRFIENDQMALADGVGVQTVETLEHDDGVVHHSIVSKFPIAGPDGATALIGGMAIDITERQQMEEDLRRYREELETLVMERTAQLSDVNKKLRAENAQRLRIEREAVRLLKQIVTIQEDERTRIARDLHDELGQKLTALRLKLENAKEICNEEPVCDEIDATQSIANQIDADVSFLAWALHPVSLAASGLPSAIASYLKEWARFSTIKADFHAKSWGETRLDPEVEANLYRIVQEALNNAQKYANAKTISVLLEKRRYDILLIIEDDGVGFDPKQKRKGTGGLGLVGMRERATLLGGNIEIESSPGAGATIFVRVPV